MQLKILLVDDEALARSRLKILLANCRLPSAEVLVEAANAAQAMAALPCGQFDLVLLDIGMPGMNGLVLAKAINSLHRPPLLVFVTAHAEHALCAFDLCAADYLTKPVSQQRLQQALQKVERRLLAAPAEDASLALLNPPSPMPAVQEMLIIHDRGRTERVPLASVLFLKAELKYITVQTLARSYILDGSLSELEEKYPQQLVRVHRNALVAKVAMRALEKYSDPEQGDSWALHLHGLEGQANALAVSRRQLSAVRQALLA